MNSTGQTQAGRDLVRYTKASTRMEERRRHKQLYNFHIWKNNIFSTDISPHIFKHSLIYLSLFWRKMCEGNYFWTHVVSRYLSLAGEVRDSILGISHENFCPRNSNPVFFSVVRNISIERFPVRWITCRRVLYVLTVNSQANKNRPLPFS